MREELRLGNPSPISQRLYNMLTEVKENENQAMLFLNRRGYSSHISCKECGEVLECPRCSVSLTHHTSGGVSRLICHTCGYRTPTPRACPSCSADALSFRGFGTQKLESEMSKYHTTPRKAACRFSAARASASAIRPSRCSIRPWICKHARKTSSAGRHRSFSTRWIIVMAC